MAAAQALQGQSSVRPAVIPPDHDHAEGSQGAAGGAGDHGSCPGGNLFGLVSAHHRDEAGQGAPAPRSAWGYAVGPTGHASCFSIRPARRS